MFRNLVLLIVIVGCIISVMIEVPKQYWKKRYPYISFPSWIPMALGVSLSVLSAVVVYSIFRSYPALSALVLDGTNKLVIVPYAVVFFLAQYFTSMEIVKRIVNGFLKIAGINIKDKL